MSKKGKRPAYFSKHSCWDEDGNPWNGDFEDYNKALKRQPRYCAQCDDIAYEAKAKHTKFHRWYQKEGITFKCAVCKLGFGEQGDYFAHCNGYHEVNPHRDFEYDHDQYSDESDEDEDEGFPSILTSAYIDKVRDRY